MDDSRASHPERAFPLEIISVWTLFALVALAMLVTYSRVPPGDLYNVSHHGLAGGASRVLVFLNWPLALVAIPVLALLLPRLRNTGELAAGILGIALSAVVFWPGVVEQSDLDARPVNALPALGVAIAVVLTVASARGVGLGWEPWQWGDRVRVALATVAVVLAIPWMGADLGVYLGDVPILGRIYQTGELTREPGVAGLHPAVHPGHHHGMSGVLLVLAALLLSRLLLKHARGWPRGLLRGYLAVMLFYGLGNIANDVWLEQVVKRGWTDWQIDSVTTPRVNAEWGVVLVAAAALWAMAAIRSRHG